MTSDVLRASMYASGVVAGSVIALALVSTMLLVWVAVRRRNRERREEQERWIRRIQGLS